MIIVASLSALPGPPPQYTPEDRSLERDFDNLDHVPRSGRGPRPMVTDLDLDDPAGDPPDLPPPMAMLPNSRVPDTGE